MKRPSFQFYPADWRNNAKLRRCSWEARGAWVEVMCLLHDSEEYGLLRWSLKEITQAIGAPIKLLRELVDKGVIKGSDGAYESLIYTPRSGRKDGPPVEVLAAGAGPCWYSSRMVVDEYKKNTSGGTTRFGQKDAPIPSPSPRQGEAQSEALGHSSTHRKSDGSTSTSTTTYISKEVTLSNSGGSARDFEKSSPTPKPESARVVAVLAQNGIPDVSPSHPEVLALIAKGITPEVFEAAAKKSVNATNRFAYVLTVVKSSLQSAAEIEAGPSVGEVAWDTNRQTIEAMGVRVGIGKWDEMAVVNREPFAGYVIRVRQAMAEQEIPA